MKYLPIILLILVSSCATRSKESPATVGEPVSDPLELAQIHYTAMIGTLDAGEFPRSYEKGEFITSGSGWWCSGFYPGSLLYLFEHSGDSLFRRAAYSKLDELTGEQYNTSTHDLGFMMYCSFGNAYRLNPTVKHREILINSAKSLATRFSPKTMTIRSWDSGPDDFLVIIDNMMNLELLFWATRQTGDSSFYKIAVSHANTTLKNHFREDNSSYHVINYDQETGEVKERKTAQGLADSSAWARGQVWGLYGYTVTFRETGDSVYLKQAVNIADFILNHPNLPEDRIPVWDFDAPSDDPRDASAAAIMASALLELDYYLPGRDYGTIAREIVDVLTSDYTATPGTNGNFIIEHGVGHLPRNSEVDVPLSYADYYYIEALMRMERGIDSI